MLAPSTDIRSSNALETVQNQYQIQGLELDYCIVCWDADLRREGDKWVAYKLSGSDWQKDSLIEVAKNGYRVLLTRARKGACVPDDKLILGPAASSAVPNVEVEGLTAPFREHGDRIVERTWILRAQFEEPRELRFEPRLRPAIDLLPQQRRH
jgi:hypothetical protein